MFAYALAERRRLSIRNGGCRDHRVAICSGYRGSASDLEPDPNSNDTESDRSLVLEESSVRSKVDLDKSRPSSLGTTVLAVSARGRDGGFFAVDRAVPPRSPTDPAKLNRYIDGFRTTGSIPWLARAADCICGASSPMTITSGDRHSCGRSRDRRSRRDAALEYSLGRERPNQGQAWGIFFSMGPRFPPTIRSWPGRSPASLRTNIQDPYAGGGLRDGDGSERFAGPREAAFPVGCGRGRRHRVADRPPDLSSPSRSGTGSRRLGHPVGKGARGTAGIATTWDRRLFLWIVGCMPRSNGSQRWVMSTRKCWAQALDAHRVRAARGRGWRNIAKRRPLERRGGSTASRLAQEFAYETALLGGGRNLSANMNRSTREQFRSAARP